MRKGVKVWGLIVIVVFVGSVFSGAVSAENISEDLMESVPMRSRLIKTTLFRLLLMTLRQQ
ncbi:MAG: hypothetical protein QMD22_11205 [archaeon]|nr:hypothetical protein [archaeon]